MYKRISITLFVLLILATGLFGQTAVRQDKSKPLTAWSQDSWYEFASGATQIMDNIWHKNIKQGDTVACAANMLWPYQFIEATVEDQVVGTDSVSLIVRYSASSTSGAATMKLIGSLVWRKQDGTVAGTTIDAPGEYWAYFGDLSHPGLTFYMVEIIAVAGHRKIDDGVNIRLKTKGLKL